MAGLSFISDTLDSFATSNAFDDLNKSAESFRDYLSQNPQLAKELGSQLAGIAKDGMTALGTEAKSLLGYLKEHPNAIRQSVQAMSEFAQSIGKALDYALKLVKPLADAASFIATTESKLQQVTQQPIKSPNGPLKDVNDSNNPFVKGAIWVSQKLGLNLDIGDRTGQAASTPTVRKPIQLLGDPNKQHHGGNAYRTETIDGRQETVRYGTGRLTKDLIFPADSPIPAPIGGIVRLRNDDPKGYGLYADLENLKGEVQARLAHFSKFADIKSGQVIEPGQIVGYQGHTGNAKGDHLHIELPREIFPAYVQGIKTGDYSALPRVQATSPAMQATSQQRAEVAQPSKGVATVNQDIGWKTTSASWYDNEPTASGRVMKDDLNTVAHKTLPFGTQIEFKGANGQTQTATVTDRGPYIKGREFDLSAGLAKRLGTYDAGVANLQYRILGKGQTPSASSSTAASTTSDNLNGSTKPQEQPATVKASLEGIKLREQNERDLRLRKSGEEISSYSNRTNNLTYEATKNPSIDQRNQKALSDIQQKYDSEISNLRNSIQDAKSRVGINKNNLSAGNLSEDATKAINEQITLDNKLIDSNTKNLNQVTAAKAKAVQDLQSSQSNEAQYHAQLQEFNLRENGLKQLQEQIGYFKQLNQNDPNDEIALKLPDLQKQYDIKTAGLELDKQIVDIRQKAIKGELSSDEAQKQITALDEYNQYQEHRINLEYEAAKSAATLQIAQKNLNQSLRESSDYLQVLQRDLQKSQLGLGGNAIALQKEIGGLSSQNTYDQGVLGLMGEKLDPREKERRLQQLDQQMADEAAISEAQARKESRKRQLSSSQSVLSSYQDLFNEQGGNDKGVSQILGKAQLNLDYKSKLSDLTDLRDTGELTNTQFIAMKKNLEAMNNVKLSKLEGEFNILKKPLADLEDFGKNALKDLITGSKSLGDVLADLASTLAGTFANSAVESIFGDLLGNNKKGGGLFSGESSGIGGGITGILGSLSGLLGFSSGGIIPAFASGGLIGSGSLADQLQDESSKTGRQARLVIASEGERILSHRETAIWERLNRPINSFAAGGMVGSSSSNNSNGNSVNVSIAINNPGNNKGGGYTPEQTAAFKQAVEAVVMNSMRPGGALYSRGK